MIFNLTIVGFGVIGVEALHSIISKVGKNKKINIAIIEKNIRNIPGGVAYSKINSKFGFFNNPLRLSHPSFIRWIKNKNNLSRLIEFINSSPSYNLKNWLKKNQKAFFNTSLLSEIYFPRLTYSFYLEDKIAEINKILKKKKIKLLFLKGNLNNIKFIGSNLLLKSKGNFRKFKVSIKNERLNIFLDKKKISSLRSKRIIVGCGLLPPKKIMLSKNLKDRNYIWDFYDEGGTKNLLDKINNLKLKRNKISITFIGNKAGLLETTLQMKKLILNDGYKLNINVISKKFSTLNKAKLSRNFEKFKFKFFTRKKIDKIKKAQDILSILKMEFKIALANGFNKYDVWTSVLKNNVLIMAISKLNSEEKKNYNLFIFPKIRNLTRFTYPETIEAKDKLEKLKKIKNIKGKAVSVQKTKKYLYVILNNKRKIKSDIVVNVSGPVNLVDLNNDSKLIKSIKNNFLNFEKGGFLTDKNFMLSKQIFTPGVLAYNFNPLRQTIIKAVTNNTRKTTEYLLMKENL